MKTFSVTPFAVAGPSARTNNAQEAGNAGQIPALWARYAKEHGVAPGPVYAVYSDYASDAAGDYTLTIGTRTTAGAPASATVAAGSYLTFAADGERPHAILAAWQAVWAYFEQPRAWQRAYATDFEQNDGPQSATLYIGVRPADSA